MTDFCDEHDYERVGIKEWDTKYERLNERFYTAIYECQDCPAKRWSAEQRQSVLDWSG